MLLWRLPKGVLWAPSWGSFVNSFMSYRGIGMPRPFLVLLMGFISAVLTVTMLPGNTTAAEAITLSGESSTEDPGTDTDGDGDLDRPTTAEAAATAALAKERVEDLSKRAETSRTFANPDGTSTLEMSTGIRRVQDEDGKWRDLDLDIVKKDGGSYAPKVAASDVVIGGGGSKEAVRLNLGDDKSLSLSWPTVLPEPTIDGGVATYAIDDSTDLLVITTRTGVATRIRLNEKPADDADLSLVVRSEGVDVKTTPDGALEINDGDKMVASTEPMTAWDAQSTKGGDPINVVPVEPSLEDISSTGDVERQELTLATPTEFLDDPATEYPVVVDPDLNNVWISHDTMVRDGVTTSMGSDSRLWAGRLPEDSSGKAYRSFIKWKDDQLLGKDILAATMGFYQYDAGRCTDSLMYVHALGAAFTNAGTTWANQPAIRSSTSHSISFYQQRGNESCGGTNGWVTGNATNMASDWAKGTTNGGYVNHGVRMNIPGANEPDATYSRRFCSSNEDAAHTSCNTTTRDPYLNITYNGPPDVADAPSATPSRMSDDELTYLGSTNPTWTTAATDSEASLIKYTTEAHTSTETSATTLKATCTTVLVSTDTPASCTPTANLTDGSTYWARSRATDSHGAIGPWSEWLQFIVDTSPYIESVGLSVEDSVASFELSLYDNSGGNVRAKLTVKRDSTTISDTLTAFVPSGEAVTEEISGLAVGTYTYTAWADTGQRLSSTPLSGSFEVLDVEDSAAGSTPPPLSCAKFATDSISGLWSCLDDAAYSVGDDGEDVVTELGPSEDGELVPLDSLSAEELAAIDELPTVHPMYVIDAYHAKKSTIWYFGTGTKLSGSIRFTFNIGLHNHSANVWMTADATREVRVTWRTRIRHHIGGAPDENVFVYPDTHGCSTAKLTCKDYEDRYGDGYNKLPRQTGWKVFWEAYNTSLIVDGTKYPGSPKAQSDRATCYKVANCKFLG